MMSYKLLLRILLIITVLLVSFSHALSTDWAYIGENEAKPVFVYYIDSESLMIKGNKITFWSKWENKDIGEGKSKKTIDCEEHKIRTTVMHLYDRYGSLLKSESGGNNGEWLKIVPDSNSDFFRNLLCNKDNKPREDAKEYLESWRVLLSFFYKNTTYHSSIPRNYSERRR
jgi:hypothetical protein